MELKHIHSYLKKKNKKHKKKQQKKKQKKQQKKKKQKTKKKQKPMTEFSELKTKLLEERMFFDYSKEFSSSFFMARGTYGIQILYWFFLFFLFFSFWE